MKVSPRQKQNQTGNVQKIREVCPACKTHYLRTFFAPETVDKKRKFVKKGKYCPNELCTFCRKD